MKKTCFITGVTKGIGLELAKRALQDGWRVCGCARSADAVARIKKEISNDDFLPFVADVTDLESLNKVALDISDEFGKLNAIVVNAGVGIDGELLELSTQDMEKAFSVNFFGAHNTVKVFVPYLMRKSNIVFVSSIVAHLAIPRMGAYCASKHALECYALTLSMELKEKNIRVCTICPGGVKTSFGSSVIKVGKTWKGKVGTPVSAKSVAKRAFRQMVSGKPKTIVYPFSSKILSIIMKICPSVVYNRMALWLKNMDD